jgi:hypothetical protein
MFYISFYPMQSIKYLYKNVHEKMTQKSKMGLN